VSFPVGRSRFLGWCLLSWLLISTVLLTMAAMQGWSRSAPEVGWQWAGLLGMTSVWNVKLCWRWWRTPIGWLTWEPASMNLTDVRERTSHWLWTPAAGLSTVPIGVPVVVLDGQIGMGLRVTPHALNARRIFFIFVIPSNAHPLWFWVERSMHPERWSALRRALWAGRSA